jgi:3'(2'), 5'-bisphosphate nucleotidase
MTDARSDAALAREAALAAARVVLDIRESYGDLSDRATAKALRDEADAAAHDVIAALLAEHRPDDALLSEEGVDDADRLDAERVWIVDPLDGTWEFGQGRDDFAVHVAIWQRSAGPYGALTDGVVVLPARDRVHSTNIPPAPSLQLPTDRPLRLVVSRTRPPADLDAMTDHLRVSTGLAVVVGSVGSAGAKTAEVLEGRYDAYIHDAGLSEWDVAAPAVVALAAGLRVAHLDGSDIRYNRMPPLVGDLVIGIPVVVDAVIAALR